MRVTGVTRWSWPAARLITATALLFGLMVGTGLYTFVYAKGYSYVTNDPQACATNPFYRVVDLDDETTDPEIWGKNFPMQYDGYKRTVDQERTKYGGSEAVPRTPTAADPRSIRCPVAARGRPPTEDDLGRLCFFERFPGRARACLHA